MLFFYQFYRPTQSCQTIFAINLKVITFIINTKYTEHASGSGRLRRVKVAAGLQSEVNATIAVKQWMPLVSS